MKKLYKMTEEEFRQAKIAYLNSENLLKGDLEEELLKIFDIELNKDFNGLLPVDGVNDDMYYIEYKGKYIASLKTDKDYEYINDDILRVYTFQRLDNIFNAHHTSFDKFGDECFKEEHIKISWLNTADKDYYIVDSSIHKAIKLVENCEELILAIKELHIRLLENGYVDFNVWKEATVEEIELLENNNLR